MTSFYISVLVYCGRNLQDAEPLSAYGLAGGCTVHALRKKQPEPEPKSGKFVCELL